jgi:2,3-bisphosphoglycerate-independent phosphoglycerate mutase
VKKVLLIILDGFGISKKITGNAVAAAKMPFFKKLQNQNPHTFLQTHGAASGLPENQTGASELGHVVLGAGRRVFQPLEKINRAFSTDEISRNSKFQKFLKIAKTAPRVYLIGLLSDGGVHSSIFHLEKILEILKNMNGGP